MNIYLVFILIACGIFGAAGLLAYSLVLLLKKIDKACKKRRSIKKFPSERKR